MYKVGDKVIIIKDCGGDDNPSMYFGMSKGDVVTLLQVSDNVVRFNPLWITPIPFTWSKRAVAPLTDLAEELYLSSETK